MSELRSWLRYDCKTGRVSVRSKSILALAWLALAAPIEVHGQSTAPSTQPVESAYVTQVIARSIAELASPDPPVRERAERILAGIGQPAESSVRAATHSDIP